MTIEARRGKAPWPMSAFVALLVTMLLAGGSVFWAFAQTAANADHRVLVQRIQADENELEQLQNITVNNTGNIVDLKQEFSAIKAQTEEILAILKGEYR